MARGERPSVGYALLGCGLMGARHAEVLGSLEGAALRTAFDTDGERLRELAERFGCRPAASAEEAVAAPGVDAVLVAAPSYLHVPMAALAAEYKRHVLVEKPLSTDSASGREVIERCAAEGVRLAVVSQKRFDPGARRLRAALDRELLGRVFMAEVAINYYRDERYFAEAPWRASGEESGGGVLMNQGIHYTDLMLWFLGPVAEVRGAMGTVRPGYREEDVAVAVVEFSGGALAAVTASTVTYPNAPERLTLYGTEGSCTLVEGEGLVRWDHKGGAPPPELPPEPAPPEALPPKLHSMYRFHADFLAAVREGRPPAVAPADGLAVVAFMEQFYTSARRVTAT